MNKQERQPQPPASNEDETPSRRDFLRQMGAGAVLAGLGATENTGQDSEQLPSKAQDYKYMSENYMDSVGKLVQERGRGYMGSYMKRQFGEYQKDLSRMEKDFLAKKIDERNSIAATGEVYSRVNELDKLLEPLQNKEAFSRELSRWAVQEEVRQALITKDINLEQATVLPNLRFKEKTPEAIEEIRAKTERIANVKIWVEQTSKEISLKLSNHHFPNSDPATVEKIANQYLQAKVKKLQESADFWRKKRDEGDTLY